MSTVIIVPSVVITTAWKHTKARTPFWKLRRKELRKNLARLSRRIDLHRQLLTLSQHLYQRDHLEFKRLDRKLFEKSPGITMCKRRKRKSTADIQTSTNIEAKEPNIEELSAEERQELLERLLRIQASQAKKRSA